jgi:hypothetical protein
MKRYKEDSVAMLENCPAASHSSIDTGRIPSARDLNLRDVSSFALKWFYPHIHFVLTA